MWAVRVAAWRHPLVAWSRRALVPAYWTAIGVAVLIWATGITSGYPFVPVLILLYAVARYRSWRALVPAVAAILAVLVAAWLAGQLGAGDLATLTSTVVAAALLGTQLRTRRAYVAELAERAAAAERARIAREMHDVVAHHLAVMTALADGAALTAVAKPDRAADVLQTIATTGREALDQTQSLLGVLRDGTPASRTPQPGVDELPALVEQLRQAGLPVTLTATGTPDPATGRTVYRIVQEALTNTLKHAGPTATATVRLHHTGNGTELDITDNGQPRQGSSASGQGLAGMAERVATAGGTLEAGPVTGVGWRVSARLPARRAA